MSHITKQEYLSAFLDDEAGSFERHRIYDQLVTDDTLRDKLSSFAFIGETMRNPTQKVTTASAASLLDGIQSAIADDEIPTTSDDQVVVDIATVRAKQKRRLPKQAAGYAVAASVAVAATIGFQHYFTASPETEQLATAQQITPPASTTPIQTLVPAAVSKASPADKKPEDDYFLAANFQAPDAQTRGLMNKFVAHHLKYASSSTLMPRVRAVSYSTDF